MEYALEFEEVARNITKTRAKRVLIQLADGLKPYADIIQRELEKRTKASILIWGGSCFGACDVPQNMKELGVELIVQFGHSELR